MTPIYGTMTPDPALAGFNNSGEQTLRCPHTFGYNGCRNRYTVKNSDVGNQCDADEHVFLGFGAVKQRVLGIPGFILSSSEPQSAGEASNKIRLSCRASLSIFKRRF